MKPRTFAYEIPVSSAGRILQQGGVLGDLSGASPLFTDSKPRRRREACLRPDSALLPPTPPGSFFRNLLPSRGTEGQYSTVASGPSALRRRGSLLHAEPRIVGCASRRNLDTTRQIPPFLFSGKHSRPFVEARRASGRSVFSCGAGLAALRVASGTTSFSWPALCRATSTRQGEVPLAGPPGGTPFYPGRGSSMVGSRRAPFSPER